MVACFGAHAPRTFFGLCVVLTAAAAQYETYSFTNFPAEELVPLTEAYGLALDHYAAHNWTESIRFLELSLRLHRLLRESARYCARHCERDARRHHDDDDAPALSSADLRAYWRALMRAACAKRCRARFPALQLPPPGRLVLEEFRRRSPYRYLHFAHSMLDDLQSAVPCAFTYLQRNPQDLEMSSLMEEYRSRYDLSGYLTDHEEGAHEPLFLKGVRLVKSGDYSSAVDHLEEALRLYLHECDLCWADCEGVVPLPPDADYHAVLAEVSLHVLRCKLQCEDDLMPNVGGHFVPNFVANVYHHLQYSYYKLNNGRKAVPCAFSYFLFDPEDQVMGQNLQYYKAYRDQWGLVEEHFTPRQEAIRHFNQTAALKQIVSLVENYSSLDDQDFFGAEEAARWSPSSPDQEFEGTGDYEESIYSDWTQPKGKGDAGRPEA